MPAKWYGLQIRCGYEDKVKSWLEREPFPVSILLPKVEVSEFKKGKRVKKLKPLFPGYLFVQMDLTPSIYFAVRKIPGVIRLLGYGNRPAEIDEADLRPFQEIAQLERPIHLDQTPFKPGDLVRVTEGSFMNFIGTVRQLDPKKGTVTVVMTILGHPCPITLPISIVEPYLG